MTRYTLSFGAMSDPIVLQLENFGLALDCTAIERLKFQKCADALTMAHVNQLLTDREVDRARMRLMKKLNKHICEKKATVAA